MPLFDPIIYSLIWLATGAGLAYVILYAYIGLADESNMSSRLAHAFHHWWAGLFGFVPIGVLVSLLSPELGYVLIGIGLTLFLDDAQYHLEDLIEKRKKEGKILE